MFTEKGGNDALTIGQAVNTTFGRVLLDTGSSEHKCLSIKMKWGVIYAVSPSSIGIHVQSNGGHSVVSMDIDEEEDGVICQMMKITHQKTHIMEPFLNHNYLST